MKELKSKGANTSVYFCGECDYLAECVHDFNDHTHSSDALENVDDSLFACRFCEEGFENLSEVMKHNKLMHRSNVQQCYNFLEKSCFYGENCWFIHSESIQSSEHNFECNYCEQKFKTKNSLRHHMKTSHIQLVSKCKNEDQCKYDLEKCWFVHNENIEIAYLNAKNDGQCKNRIIDKNFDME